MSLEKPPLDLQVELSYTDGTTYRLDADAREAKDRPTGIHFRTQRYTGFADGSFSLARRIDLDYPDLQLLEGVTLVGHDGSIAFDGRVTGMPRTLEGTPAVDLAMQGWMSHASTPFVEVYVDRDLSKWVSPSRRRVVALLAGLYKLGSVNQLADEAGTPVVELAFGDNWVSPFKPISEAWWLPQPGIKIGAIAYDFALYNTATMTATDANWGVLAILNSDDQGSVRDEASLWPNTAAIHYLTAGGIRTCANLELAYNATPNGAAGASYYAHFAYLAVYGTHGLTRRGSDPGGFTVSDMMADIAKRWAPKLDTSGIQPTTLVVPHASFLTDTKPYDAWQLLNGYHRWEMDVFEDRRLNFYPIDLSDHDWEIRLSDEGTTVNLQGDDISNLANGVIVRYKDLNTGYDERLSPEEFPALLDSSPNNPANKAGEKLYTPLELSIPTTQEVAIEAGRAYLAEFNQPKAPGTITVTGHVRDRAGHWQQGWKVHSSDRLIISDFPNDRVRVVNETDWDHDTKTLKIAVDASFKAIDAILARLNNSLEASNLSFPGA